MWALTLKSKYMHKCPECETKIPYWKMLFAQYLGVSCNKCSSKLVCELKGAGWCIALVAIGIPILIGIQKIFPEAQRMLQIIMVAFPLWFLAPYVVKLKLKS